MPTTTQNQRERPPPSAVAPPPSAAAPPPSAPPPPARPTPRTPVEQVQYAAERAVLIPVGAALTATDRVAEAVTDLAKAYSTPETAQKRVERDLRRFERRGTTARNRAERRIKRTRTRVERELRQRRTRAVRVVKRNRTRVRASGQERPPRPRDRSFAEARRTARRAQRRLARRLPPAGVERRRTGRACRPHILAGTCSTSPPSTVGAPFVASRRSLTRAVGQRSVASA